MLAIADNIIFRKKKKPQDMKLCIQLEKDDCMVDVKARTGGKDMKMFGLVHSG